MQQWWKWTTPHLLCLLAYPPPLDISGEVDVDVSSEYEEVSTYTPQAWASFLKDKSVSLLCGDKVKTYFTYFDPGNTNMGVSVEVSSSSMPHNPKAQASFPKDEAVSLLLGATVQSYLDYASYTILTDIHMRSDRYYIGEYDMNSHVFNPNLAADETCNDSYKLKDCVCMDVKDW